MLAILTLTHFRDFVKKGETTGFSRVVLQFLPTREASGIEETTDFSRVEFQFRPFHATR